MFRNIITRTIATTFNIFLKVYHILIHSLTLSVYNACLLYLLCVCVCFFFSTLMSKCLFSLTFFYSPWSWSNITQEFKYQNFWIAGVLFIALAKQSIKCKNLECLFNCLLGHRFTQKKKQSCVLFSAYEYVKKIKFKFIGLKHILALHF